MAEFCMPQLIPGCLNASADMVPTLKEFILCPGRQPLEPAGPICAPVTSPLYSPTSIPRGTFWTNTQKLPLHSHVYNPTHVKAEHMSCFSLHGAHCLHHECSQRCLPWEAMRTGDTVHLPRGAQCLLCRRCMLGGRWSPLSMGRGQQTRALGSEYPSCKLTKIFPSMILTAGQETKFLTMGADELSRHDN